MFRDLVAGLDASQLAVFGEPLTYTSPAAGHTRVVVGVFDAAYLRADVGEAGISTARPMAFFRLGDLPWDPADDDPELTARGARYEVTEVAKDGQGGVQLFLRRLT